MIDYDGLGCCWCGGMIVPNTILGRLCTEDGEGKEGAVVNNNNNNK